MDDQHDRVVSRDIECAIGLDVNVLITGSDSHLRLTLARRIHHATSTRRASPLLQIPLAEDGISAIRRLVLAPPPTGGTLLIEEVTTLSPSAQAELMRLLDLAVTRVIATTGHDLFGRIASGSFDPDLFYRLNTIHLALSPATVAKA